MIYLDNHATTPIDEIVLDSMAVALSVGGVAFGNPSSTHRVGVLARRALEGARERIGALLPGRDRRVVFTSGATEANALAVMGRAPKGRRKNVVISSMEHPSVLNCARELSKRGSTLTLIDPNTEGLVDAERVVDAVTDETALVSIMLVNNEVGTVQPVAAIARRVRSLWPSCHIHIDAVQAIGLVSLDGLESASSCSISGHKIHGPKGIGALIFNERFTPRALWRGGGQEGGVRSGTQNVAGALGLAKAVELALQEWQTRARHIAELRDRLVARITALVPSATLVGHATYRSPSNAMISVAGLSGDALVGALDLMGVVVSTGSACHAGDPRPSEVLNAMRHDPTAGTVRFGLSRLTTEDDIERTVGIFADAVKTLQKGM